MEKPYVIRNVALAKKPNGRTEKAYKLSLVLISADSDKHLIEIALTNIDVMSREKTQMRRLYVAPEGATTFEFEISKEMYDTVGHGSFEVHCVLREHIDFSHYRDFKEKILLQNGRLD